MIIRCRNEYGDGTIEHIEYEVEEEAFDEAEEEDLAPEEVIRILEEVV